MASKSKNKYVDLRVSGRLFPAWVLHNFKQYKLPEILRKEGEDLCNIEVKLELRKYQEFIGKYLGPGSPYNEILLYHGLGSGKTATSINLMNVLYNYSHAINYIILIKASLHDDPWMKDLKIWLGRDPDEESVESVTKLARFSTIHFVHYDSPYADKDFINTMKGIDISKPTVYYIDEAHNFIRNVYSNINSKIGKRAQIIYDYIVREKKENKNTKIVLISATPGINTPFELSLLFNMLRPNIFPSSELEFQRTFITKSIYPILNPLKRNMFERRILGLVSYYIGATPDLYARQVIKYINLPMSQYQYGIYRIFEKLEIEIQRKARRYKKQSQLYKTYTRQACNFVFPYVSMHITGELRPRPSKFKLSEKVIDKLEKGKEKMEDVKQTERNQMNKYVEALQKFIMETEKYFQKIHEEDVKRGRTIFDDMNEFRDGFDSVFGGKFLKFYESGSSGSSESGENNEKNKSNKNTQHSHLLKELYDCSPKMIAVVFISYFSPGKVLVYTNYVFMEGIDMLKIYFKLCGFNDYTIAKENMGYCEYHGRIDPKDRIKVKNMFNNKDNIRGNKCKIILLSPSATEGIQLYNIRQEHILEPYWTEVRIQQVIGRGIRQCSHKDLPMEERIVTVYRYKVVKPEKLDPDDTIRVSTDEYIEDQAKTKANLIESFLSAMKEAAVDCELFRAHNMLSQTYQCFKFPENTIIGPNVGPAYKEDIKDDIKYDSGLHAKNAKVERIKVIKINAVYIVGTDSEGQPKYSSPDKFWFYKKSGMVYDFETHYPVGLVEFVGGFPNMLDKDTYIMSVLIDIPTATDTLNL